MGIYIYIYIYLYQVELSIRQRATVRCPAGMYTRAGAKQATRACYASSCRYKSGFTLNSVCVCKFTQIYIYIYIYIQLIYIYIQNMYLHLYIYIYMCVSGSRRSNATQSHSGLASCAKAQASARMEISTGHLGSGVRTEANNPTQQYRNKMQLQMLNQTQHQIQ